MDHLAIYAVPHRLTDGHVPHLLHFLCLFCHSFLPVEKHVWFSHTKDQQNHEERNRAAHRTSPRKHCSLRPKFWWLEWHFLFHQTNVQQWFRMNGCYAWQRDEKKEGNAQSSVYINTTKNVPNSICCYMPNVCMRKAFAPHHGVCHILIHIRTNRLTPLFL